MNDIAEISKSGCWTFDPAREVWWAKTGEQTWTEIMGTLDHPPPTYQVTATKPGGPVLVIAECPSGWHATQVATSQKQRGYVITIRRDDGKPVA
jgi:hypothetical protein